MSSSDNFAVPAGATTDQPYRTEPLPVDCIRHVTPMAAVLLLCNHVLIEAVSVTIMFKFSR
jgi:hypothetical protein